MEYQFEQLNNTIFLSDIYNIFYIFILLKKEKMSIFKRQKRNKYAKIPKKNKILFLKKVLQQKQPLKSTADLFKINYSTAKTLIRQYRAESLQLDITECSENDSQNFIQNSQGMKRCTFKEVQIEEKQAEPGLITFSTNEKENRDKKNDGKVGFILTWPLKHEKTQTIQIVSKIQFP